MKNIFTVHLHNSTYVFKATIIWAAIQTQCQHTSLSLWHLSQSSLPHYFIDLVFCAFMHGITLLPCNLNTQICRIWKVPRTMRHFFIQYHFKREVQQTGFLYYTIWFLATQSNSILATVWSSSAWQQFPLDIVFCSWH